MYVFFSILWRYKLICTNRLNLEQALELQTLEGEFDFWKHPKPGFSADIMVEPGKHLELSNLLAKNGIEFNETINDIGALIRSQEINQFEDRNFNGNISFDTYLLTCSAWL